MDGCAIGVTQSNGESKPIQDCIEISTVRSCGYSESHQARLQDQEEINNSTVECRGLTLTHLPEDFETSRF